MDSARGSGLGGRSPGGIASGDHAAEGTVELAVQLTRAGLTFDIGRLIDTNDVAYRMFLRASLRRLVELHERDVEKSKG